MKILSYSASSFVIFYGRQNNFIETNCPRAILQFFSCQNNWKLLESFGVSRSLPVHLVHFLDQKTLQLWINGATYSICDALSAIPQSSVLGPLFFSLFINDILLHAHNYQVFLLVIARFLVAFQSSTWILAQFRLT